MPVAVSLIAFQLTWFACVLGAANGFPWLGVNLSVGVCLVHIVLSGDRARDAASIAAIALVGCFADSLLAAMNLLEFGPHPLTPWPCPPWMCGLWLAFAATFRVGLRWLRGKPVVAAILGLAGGPIAYWIAAQLGARVLAASTANSLLAVAVEWTLLLPALSLLSAVLVAPSRPQRQPATDRGAPQW